MPVDVTTDTIRIRQRDPADFVEDSFSTITLSEDQGIKAVIGKLKSDPGGSTVIQTYIFDKEQWSQSEAEQWVKDHKRSGRAATERRCLKDQEMRFEINKDPDGRRQAKIIGYAAVFNQEILLFDGFFEKVQRGAFARTIADDDVRALWNHNDDYVLGRTGNRTLSLSEDERGLRYEILPPDTTWANDLITSIKRGDVNQASFGFSIVKQKRETMGTSIHRTLQEVNLFDVSPVTFPAYPTTTSDIHVRMIRSESERGYLFEDTGEVEFITGETKPDEVTGDELRRMVEELKKKVL